MLDPMLGVLSLQHFLFKSVIHHIGLSRALLDPTLDIFAGAAQRVLAAALLLVSPLDDSVRVPDDQNNE